MKQLMLLLVTVIISISLFFIGVYTAIEAVGYNDHFYYSQYVKNDTPENTDISLDDLMSITDEMQLFLQGERTDFNIYATVSGTYQPVFTQDEQSHMMDVQVLFLRFRLIRNLSVGVIVLLTAFMIVKYRYRMYRILRTAGIIDLVLLCLLLISGVFFFEQMFIAFHYLFFTNMNWSFDPLHSVLINMVPEEFFIAAATRIAAYSTAFFIIISVIFSLLACKIKPSGK